MPTLPLRAALALGILSSAFISAGNFMLAGISVPSLLNSPSPADIPTNALLTQWQQHYSWGKSSALPLVALTVASYAFGIHRSRRAIHKGVSGVPAWQLLAAGIVGIAAVPIFTVLFMEGPLGNVNGQLGALNREYNVRVPVVVTELEESGVRALCERWAVLCMIRGVFPLVTSFLGIWAATA